MGDRFSEDPFVLFQLRGRTRAKLLEDLAEQRLKVLSAIAQEGKQEDDSSEKSIIKEVIPIAPHPAVVNPKLWWKYEGNLHSDLVVITPTMDGDTGMDAAGDLPLAEEPQFPDSRRKFLDHLHEQGKNLAQQAMFQAMATDE